MTKGQLIVITGPSASGKGTVVKELLRHEGFELSVSYTTRAPREGEVPDVSYHYVSREQFESCIAQNDVLEYTEYCGCYYGTPRKPAMETLARGHNLILEIEVNGARAIKKAYPEAVLIMLLPPTYAEQEHRLRERGTESEEKIRARLEKTKAEVPQYGLFDYIVYNETGHIEQAADDILAIVRAENCRVCRHQNADKLYFGE